MGRSKGGTNKTWGKDQKYELIKPIIDGKISASQSAKNLGMSSNSILIKWIHQYQEGGIEALENQRKPGNPLA